MVKKINAVLGIAGSASVLIHIGYVIYAYLTFYYNPLLTNIFGYTTLVLSCLHIILCGVIFFFVHDKGNGMRYPGLNMRTVIQRVSGVLMMMMLILHINTFKLLSSLSGSDRVLFVAVMASQVLFYAFALLHVALSAGNALITLGLIQSIGSRRRFDVFIWLLCAVLFIVVSFVVLKTEIIMFPGGAA